MRRSLAAATPVSWWTGGLFVAGSFCFALGSLPFYFENVDPTVDAVTFFIGSIFFTSAAFLQFRGAERRSTDWWAGAVQFVGTLLFNISTFAATQSDLDFEEEKKLIWAPDVYGSICFLIASWLAYAQVNRGIWPRSDGSVGWRINALNMAGSIAFGVAAVAARYLTTTGEPANIRMVNLGTFAGAVCFLIGAALLPVQSAREAAPA